ncbi:MAG: uroporphyrinogen-III synthase [Rhodoblastus sp.]
MKVLVLRASQDARRTAARLESAGYSVVVSPVLDIRHFEFSAAPGEQDVVAATSAHAFGLPALLGPLRGLPLFVVGARTAEAAQEAGFHAPGIVAANAQELALAVTKLLPAGARAIYLAGRDRKDDLEKAFAGRCDLRIVEAYAAEPASALAPAAVEALLSGQIGAVLHYSQRSAALFLSLARAGGLDSVLAKPRHIVISADAAAPLVAAGLPVAVARTPNEEAMIEQLQRAEETGSKKGGTS